MKHLIKPLTVLYVMMGATSLPTNAAAFSDEYEPLSEKSAAEVLNNKELGPGYAVLSPVKSDGLLRHYQLQTDLGIEQIIGDGLLKLRLSELQVLVALEGLKNDTSFVEGLKQSAKKPVEFVESTIKDPVGTVKNTASGVGRVLGRIGKGVEDTVTGKVGSPKQIAKTITGQAHTRRELAMQLGVDPYTFYNPLSERLDRTASVTTVGNWTVSAITSLLPGGILANATRQADNIRNLVVDSTPAELESRSAQALRNAGVTQTTISALEANPFYTLSEKAIIAYQLQAMSGVIDLDKIAFEAAIVEAREAAYFQLRHVVLLETYNRTIAALGDIKSVAGHTVAMRRDGIAAVIYPYDMITWTKPVAQKFSAIHEGLAGLAFPPIGVDLLITGELTPMAAERIASFGWEITGEYPMPQGPVY